MRHFLFPADAAPAGVSEIDGMHLEDIGPVVSPRWRARALGIFLAINSAIWVAGATFILRHVFG